MVDACDSLAADAEEDEDDQWTEAGTIITQEFFPPVSTSG